MKTISEFNAWLSQHFTVVPGEPKAYYEKPTGIYGSMERHTYASYRQGVILSVESTNRQNIQRLASQEDADEILIDLLVDTLSYQRRTVTGEKPVLAIRSPLQITTSEVDVYDEMQDGIRKEDVEDGKATVPHGFALDFASGCYKKCLSVEIRRHLFFRCVIEGVNPQLQEIMSGPQGAPVLYLNAGAYAPVSGISIYGNDPGHSHSVLDAGHHQNIIYDPGNTHGVSDPLYIHGTKIPMKNMSTELAQQCLDSAVLTSSPPRKGMSDLNPLAHLGSAANPLNATNYAALVKNGYKTDAEVALAAARHKDYLHNRRLPVTLGGGAKQIKPALSGFDRIKDI